MSAPVNQYPAEMIPDLFGGHVLIAVMDDAGTLCESCVRDPQNPVHSGEAGNDGWGIIGWSYSGETDDYTTCDHCGRVLVEDYE